MVKLGTWTTIDCPVGGAEKEGMAFSFLSKRFKEIGGTVRRVMNDHDFGPYPSFEVDMPVEVEDMEEDDILREEWVKKANEIEQDYVDEFDGNL